MRPVSNLIVGCGYLGLRVARRLLERGETVFATTRSSDRARSFTAKGIDPIIVDVMDGDSLARLPTVDKVLYCVGYDRKSGVPLRDVYVAGLRKALGRLHDRAGHLVYVSSTGVFGQDDGEWVDEASPTEPRTESGRACLEAEGVIWSYATETTLRAVILRLSGLYGPGRIIRRDALRQGEPIIGDPDKWLNMIHIDDAATAALAALDRGVPRSVYLGSDDHPSRRAEFYGKAAEVLGGPPPRFVAPEPGAGPAREESNKRVRNRRLREELGVTLSYPDYTVGLPAALAAESSEPAG